MLLLVGSWCSSVNAMENQG